MVLVRFLLIAEVIFLGCNFHSLPNDRVWPATSLNTKKRAKKDENQTSSLSACSFSIAEEVGTGCRLPESPRHGVSPFPNKGKESDEGIEGWTTRSLGGPPAIFC